MGENVLLNIEIDKEKRTLLKTVAAKNETTIKAILLKLIDDYIKENE